jgi:radical SAM protein with 4Fe4S-binding SPASM domain
MGCPQCYASSNPDGVHMAFDDVARILRQLAEAGTCQLAIGGGEPLLHPDIVAILELAHELGLVPNVTTTGLALNPRVLETMARCCGAVALSLEDVGEGFALRRRAGFGFFEAALKKLRDHGIRTVFQVTLSGENLPRLPAIVDYCLSVPDLYGVIFLAHKPAGRGEGYDTPLSAVHPDELYPWLREAFLRLSGHTKVGYDCCLTPGIAGIDLELGFSDQDLLEGCSAGRTSVGISADLDVVPCTFLTHRPLGNLGERSFLEIWHGPAAVAFRAGLDTLGDGRTACETCRLRGSCLGGCPEWDLVRCTSRPPEAD